ncbi:MAG TPA: 4Fe-4S binding protein [Dehalococcoidales bacterium]|nr:4Fe-4S binding protein [Dehalococcoidales bacterium]
MVKKYENIFKTENAWSDANVSFLCLDTGSWRTKRPVLDAAKCNSCGLCAMYCPPQCIKEASDVFTINLAYCKGCGICVTECPKKAIVMRPEGEFDDN